MSTKKVKVDDGGVLVGLVTASGDRCKKYQIRKHGVGVWTCTCMAYRFTRGEIGKKFPCKHMRQLWKEKNGLTDGIQILAPQAL